MLYLFIYGLFMFLLVSLNEFGRKQTEEHFLVADRKVGGFLGSMSIAASWIWAPAIFVSTKTGYEWGYSGLVWFCIPNMLALVVFAPVAARVRASLPEGFSYIEYIREKGGYFRETQLTVQLLMQIVIFALQLTAGGELLARASGLSYSTIVFAMTLTPISYCLLSGLHSSIFTDSLQYLVMVIGISFILFGVTSAVDFQWSATKPFEPFDAKLLTEFGISSCVSLLCAIFADHQQWQRAFAVKRSKLVPTFVLGGVLHFVVTASLGTLGVIIAQTGFKPDNTELTGALFLSNYFPQIYLVTLVIVALCGLCSTLDSALCAFSSLISTELLPSRNKVSTSRIGMLALAVVACCIGQLRIPIVTLWFIAGTLRLSSCAPTVLSILRPTFSGARGTAAILCGALLGGSLFAIGVFSGNMTLRTTGMVLALLSSWIVCSSFRIADREQSSHRK